MQAALDEQRAKFDEAWADLTKEHDKALVDLEKANAENADLRGEIASKDEDIRQLKEAIAKFDPDGDGKPGGSKPKAAS